METASKIALDSLRKALETCFHMVTKYPTSQGYYLLFLDTEFTDFIDCELISIGFVSENGAHEFYAERRDFEVKRCSTWVQSNVLPLLTEPESCRLTRCELHNCLWAWFEGLPAPAVVAFDYTTDWELLLDALLDFGRDTPPQNLVSGRNIASLQTDPMFAGAMQQFFAQHPSRHHALVDAKALRAGWIAWSRAHL